jgi:AraC-like DNA-binding protein
MRRSVLPPRHREILSPPILREPPAEPASRSSNSPPLFAQVIVWRAAGGAEAPLCRWLPSPAETAGIAAAGNSEPQAAAVRGGLSGWQRKAVADYIEANLGAVLRLSDMARLARLSPYHFARAFKQSFGIAPHRYHVGRRIERAKDLLGDPANSVTAIALELGFAETSSFSSTFRRVTGASPSGFRRARI